MSRGDINDVWSVIEGIRSEVGKISIDVGALKIESAHCKKNQESTAEDLKDMCAQLKATDAAIQRKMSENTQELKGAFDDFGRLVSAQITVLMEAHLIRKGAESAAIGIAKYIPKIIIAIVSATFAATVVWMSKP